MLNDYAEVRPLGANTYLVKNGISLAFLRYLSSADRALFFMVLHRL